MPALTPKNELTREDFYFNEQGLMVMTEAYHRKRGYCCGSACKHCPYDYVNVTPAKREVLRKLGKWPVND